MQIDLRGANNRSDLVPDSIDNSQVRVRFVARLHNTEGGTYRMSRLMSRRMSRLLSRYIGSLSYEL